MTTYITRANHPSRWANVQVDCCPSIPWDVLQAPALAAKGERYQGHGKSGGIQLHSMDLGFSRYGLVLRCIQGTNGRKLWQATKGDAVIFSHPKHDAALAGAVMVLTGA